MYIYICNMVSKLVVVLLLLPLVGVGIRMMALLEVDPIDFAHRHYVEVRGDHRELFDFLITNPYALEKLLPWLRRLKEADKRIISVGKSYMAMLEIPFIGEKQIFARLKEYKRSELLVFEFTDDLFNQNIAIRTCCCYGRTILRTDIHYQRKSLLYQYTIGFILRWILKHQLEKSMSVVAKIFENLHQKHGIPDFSRYDHMIYNK